MTELGFEFSKVEGLEGKSFDRDQILTEEDVLRKVFEMNKKYNNLARKTKKGGEKNNDKKKDEKIQNKKKTK